jgi:peptidoglycan hydrolase-like protein with peptidoglycan-binding domain
VRAQPCQGDAVGKNEIACTSDDSPRCNPEVKWVQTRLVAKGYRVRVDGSEGEETRNALRKFIKANNLGEGSEVTDKVLQALAA